MPTSGKREMAFLELQSIEAGYGRGPNILDELSLTFQERTCTCIVGPNGAGKSTMLKAIAGLLSLRQGEVVFNGQTISGLRPHKVLARGISFIPQERCLFPDMTVRDNLLMGAYIEGRGWRGLEPRLEEVYEAFPVLRERADQRTKVLSGGEQRMVALARSLLLRPDVLLIDEPSLGLAPRASDLIFNHIRRLKAWGMTIVLVEQNVRRGLAVADRGVVLDLGKLRFEGSPEQILNDPRIRELYLGRQMVNRLREGG